MRFLLILILLTILPALALAYGPIASTQVQVYVFDPPKVQVKLYQDFDKLICAWQIHDLDKVDSFTSFAHMAKDGKIRSKNADCKEKRCSMELDYEQGTWTCSVLVRDSYGGLGFGYAKFSPTPLSFLGGLLNFLA